MFDFRNFVQSNCVKKCLFIFTYILDFYIFFRFDAQMDFLRDFASNHTSPLPSTSTTNYPYSKGTLLHQKQHLSKKFTTHSLPRKFSASGRRNSSNVNTEQNNGEDHSSYYTNPKSLLFASKSMVVLASVFYFLKIKSLIFVSCSCR